MKVFEVINGWYLKAYWLISLRVTIMLMVDTRANCKLLLRDGSWKIVY